MSLIRTGDGSMTVLSVQYGVTYHSLHGAVTESDHVFISAGLRHQAAHQRHIAILEVGFGTGLNAFMTWLEADRQDLSIHYTALELYPLEMEAVQLLEYGKALQVPEKQQDFLALHQVAWNSPHCFSDHFTLEKRLEAIESFQRPDSFNLIYFDAFAPQAQPELWSAEVMSHMYACLRPGGTLVTYCAQGEFKRNLKKAGFTVERLPGPPGKREMTRATV